MATFDEQRALEDVEKLREQVLEARVERRRAEDAFEAFTSSFRTQPLKRESEAPVPPPAPNAPAEIPAVIDDGNTAVRAAAELNAPETVSGATHPIVTSKRGWRPDGRALVFAGVAVAGAAIYALRGGQPGPQVATPEETAATTGSTPPTAAPPPVPVATPPASSPVPTSGVNVELTTRRRVWIRVTLDGQRAFEREVPADQHIPLHADRSILIRAGDAGAVAVRQNGRDAGPLGRDGVVATREFTTGPTR
jgi:cytoskeleton protein RodZ